jgi:uncharacterized protein (TIGR03067 family)
MNASLVLGLLFSLSAPALKEKPPKEPPSIVGEWELTSSAVSGCPDTARVDKIVITADRWSVIKNGRESLGMVLRSAKPGELDLGNQQAPEFIGIYKFEGNTLTICLSLRNDQRPTDYISTINSNTQLMTLKRIKPEK